MVRLWSPPRSPTKRIHRRGRFNGPWDDDLHFRTEGGTTSGEGVVRSTGRVDDYRQVDQTWGAPDEFTNYHRWPIPVTRHWGVPARPLSEGWKMGRGPKN